ncbi:MAG: phosphotransferase [Actinomycetales bacterium]|nr:phosphotransferase [Actinomycetales bacterium]
MAICIPDPALRRAAALFDVPEPSLRRLDRQGAPDGAVFRGRRAGREVYLKLVPKGPEQLPELTDRLAFAAHLHGNGIRVVEPVPSTGGALVEHVEADGSSFLCSLTHAAPGRHLGLHHLRRAPRLIGSWAALLGRMHALSAGYRSGPNLPHWRDEHRYFTETCTDPGLGTLWARLGADLSALPEDATVFGAIHNDLHLGNLLVDDDGTLTVLDFDVCARHWFATDLGIALFHPVWQLRNQRGDDLAGFAEEAAGFAGAFLSAYAEQYPLDPGWRSLLPTFVRYRAVLVVQAIRLELDGAPLPGPVARLRDELVGGGPIDEVRF